MLNGFLHHPRCSSLTNRETENKEFKVVPRSDVNEMVVFNIRHSLSRSAFERTKLDANLTTCFQDRGKYIRKGSRFWATERRNDVSGGVNFPSLCERRMIDYISIVCVSWYALLAVWNLIRWINNYDLEAIHSISRSDAKFFTRAGNEKFRKSSEISNFRRNNWFDRNIGSTGTPARN